ncbi:DUF2178 domain-containing protein [Candidatus Gracilibacteria bacterium]|nr:DUF2178 domain-containing protein [Candidatus Gracilibacteria bacterium]
MQYKKYRAFKIGVVIALAITISSFVSAGDFVVPLIAFVVAVAIVFFASRKVDQIQNDERVEKIGGKAARWVLTVLALGGAGASIVFTALAKNYPALQIPAYIASGVVWFVLVGYSVLFYLFNRRGEGKTESKCFALSLA